MSGRSRKKSRGADGPTPPAPLPMREGGGRPVQPTPAPPFLRREGGRWGLGPAPSAAHLPAPTVWPCAAAAGITLLAFGLVTTLAFSLAGALLLALALGAWLRELFREE
jgi:hypothetical protein